MKKRVWILTSLLTASLAAGTTFAAESAKEETEETAEEFEVEIEDEDLEDEEIEDEDFEDEDYDDEELEEEWVYEEPDWSQYELADMSEYTFLVPYEEDFVLYDFTVKDILKELEEGKHFIVYASSPKCPWCRSTTPVLNEVAKEAGVNIAYLNTRKDPSWTSNLEVTDYELFAEAFEEWLPLDDDDVVHLYTPHVFFVADGDIVIDHPGTVDSYETLGDPSVPMTEEEQEELKEIYKEWLSLIL